MVMVWVQTWRIPPSPTALFKGMSQIHREITQTSSFVEGTWNFWMSAVACGFTQSSCHQWIEDAQLRWVAVEKASLWLHISSNFRNWNFRCLSMEATNRGSPRTLNYKMWLSRVSIGGGNPTNQHLSSWRFENQKLLFFQILAQSWFVQYFEITMNMELYQTRVSSTWTVQKPPPIP